MPTQITHLYHHRLHTLDEGTPIITRRLGRPDRSGQYTNHDGKPAIITEQDPYPVLIGPTVHVYQVERS